MLGIRIGGMVIDGMLKDVMESDGGGEEVLVMEIVSLPSFPLVEPPFPVSLGFPPPVLLPQLRSSQHLCTPLKITQ